MPRVIHNLAVARRGLSFAELIIGMMITGIIMVALAAFLSAVGTGWKQTATNQKTGVASLRSGQQMQNALGGVLSIAQIKTGGGAGESAYLFYWKEDSFGEAADGKAQFGEMGLIEYDPAAQAVWQYEPKSQAAMTAAERLEAGNSEWDDSTDPAVVTYFKNSNFLAARKAIVGGEGGETKVTAAELSGFVPRGGRPMVMYNLLIDNNGQESAASGTVTLRAAQTPTNLTANTN